MVGLGSQTGGEASRQVGWSKLLQLLWVLSDLVLIWQGARAALS